MIDSLLFLRYCRFRCLSILCFFKEITVNITHFETCKDYWHCNETKFRRIYLDLEKILETFCVIFLMFNHPMGCLNQSCKFNVNECKSTGGSVVEFSPATREARVRFPASAKLFLLIIVIFYLLLPDIKQLNIFYVFETEIEIDSATVLFF